MKCESGIVLFFGNCGIFCTFAYLHFVPVVVQVLEV